MKDPDFKAEWGALESEDYSKQHKKAWEFDAYDFWVRTAGTPEERASKDKENLNRRGM